MKYLYLAILAIILAGQPCLAKEYQFTFHVPGGDKINTLKYRIEGKDRWEALEKAGAFCGTFFGVGTRQMSEQQALDIIDACANPVFD